MATPAPTQRRPAEVEVPRLSREQIEQRAGRAFDSAIVSVLSQYFRGAPPASEMNQIRRMADEEMRARGDQANIGNVLDRFVRDNPDSVVARYVRFTGGNTDWILNARGQVAFSQSALTRLVTSFFAPAKAAAITALVDLGGNPRLRGRDIDFSPVDLVLARRRVPPARQGEEEQVIETRAGSVLNATFAAQISRGPNELAATSTFRDSDSRMVLASRLPPPPQEIGADEFRRRPGG